MPRMGPEFWKDRKGCNPEKHLLRPPRAEKPNEDRVRPGRFSATSRPRSVVSYGAASRPPSSQAFRPTPEASSGFRRGRRADGGITCSGLGGPVGQWAGRDHFAGRRQGSGGSWRLQGVQGDDPERRGRKGQPQRRAGGAEPACHAVTWGERAEPLIPGPVLGRGAPAGDELPATRPQGLLPPGGDQNGLGGPRRVPGPAARGLWCLWCSVVSVRRAGRQAGQAAAGDNRAGSLAKLSAPQLCSRQPHW